MKLIIAVFGKKGSGKTALIERLIKDLTNRGYKVSAIKHAGYLEIDKEGKDTWRYMKAGANAIAGITNNKVYLNINAENGLEYLRWVINEFVKISDVVITEGFLEQLKDDKGVHKVVIPWGYKEKLKVSDPIIDENASLDRYNEILGKILDLLKGLSKN